MGDAPIVDASLSPLVATESLGSIRAVALETFDKLPAAVPAAAVLAEKARGRKRNLSERDLRPLFFLEGVFVLSMALPFTSTAKFREASEAMPRTLPRAKRSHTVQGVGIASPRLVVKRENGL